MNDGDEANIYRTDPGGGDIYYCDPSLGGSQRGGGTDADYPADGVPDGYDTDCDGVPDGVELGVIAPYGPDSIIYEGKEWQAIPGATPGDNVTGYPYSPSEARYIDDNGDTIYDGIDTDGDNLSDFEEYYWVDAADATRPNDICTGWGSADQPIEATPYEMSCRFNINRYDNISFTAFPGCKSLSY